MDAPAWQVWVSASALVLSGALVAAGVGYGGYAYGRETAPQPTESSSERVYGPDDLRAAATTCGADATTVSGDTLSMSGASFAAYTRQCVVIELDAPAIAQTSYSSPVVVEQFQQDSGEYSWSNVTMTWKQTESGRDLTITVSEP